ncbi:twin arginine-targeting protein translocase TatB [Candidatus Endobugula sertula]|uniref:Twin arginine-targeting protein translocase TatB n=1 Tax=Candidatus Endobugula sertula TaxID=62101 RepID=A0A1D2QRF8_9GAMM|nr:twin arginine-targeting protein translocase TatB [Candidatus Endobugula sertula]
MGFFEILLIAVVVLLVVGPERMPDAVRSTLLTIGRVKRMLSTAFQDIEKQVGVDEIRQQLHNEDVMKSISEAQENVSQLTQAAVEQSHPSVQMTVSKPERGDDQ